MPRETLRSGDVVLRRYYEKVFGKFVELSLPDAVFLQAAELRARFIENPRRVASRLRPASRMRSAVDQ